MFRTHPITRIAALGALCAGLVLPAGALAQSPSAPRELRVERRKPDHEKLPSMRFLQANRDFLRGELDRLREKRLAASGSADTLDARFLAWQQMVAAIRAAQDSTSAIASTEARRTLMGSVKDLAALEQELDTLDRLLAAQRDRLAALQRDFAGEQRTALAVVLAGDPGPAVPAAITLTIEDQAPVVVTLDDTQRDALRRGGVVQVFHGRVEPREQAVQIDVAGSAPAWVSLDPARDRLTLVKLEWTAGATPAGPTALRASAWLHDEQTP